MMDQLLITLILIMIILPYHFVDYGEVKGCVFKGITSTIRKK